MLTLRSSVKPIFKGRINRKRYFLFSLLALLLFIGLGLLAIFISSIQFALGGFLLILVFCYAMLLIYSLVARRLRDLNHSGWWALPVFILSFHIRTPTKVYSIHTLFNNEYFSYAISALVILPSLYYLFFKGTKGSNSYGPDPLDYEEYDDYLEELESFDK